MDTNEFQPDEHEENLYSETAREDQMESDEISAEEEAFMKGYDEAEGEEDESDEPEEEDDDEDEEDEDDDDF